MSDPEHRSERVVASAVIDALMAARWKCAEILSRRSCAATAELLRGRATGLATSPFARDQILKLALDVAVLDLEKGRRPLEQGAIFFFAGGPPSKEDRAAVGKLVRQLGRNIIDTSGRLVAEFERRQRAEYLSDAQLSARLAQEAELQEATWNDPRLTAEPQVRLVIRRSVPHLSKRADELAALEQTRRCGREAPASAGVDGALYLAVVDQSPGRRPDIG